MGGKRAQRATWTIIMPCRSFVFHRLSFLSIMSCYVNHRSEAGIIQPSEQFPNTKHIQYIGYLSHDLEIVIFKIPKEHNASESYLISINWCINQLETITKRPQNTLESLQKCQTAKVRGRAPQSSHTLWQLNDCTAVYNFRVYILLNIYFHIVFYFLQFLIIFSNFFCERNDILLM